MKSTQPQPREGITKTSTCDTNNKKAKEHALQTIANDLHLLHALVGKINNLKTLEHLKDLVHDREKTLSLAQLSPYKVGDYVVVSGRFTKEYRICGLITKVNKKSLQISQLANCDPENALDLFVTSEDDKDWVVHYSYVLNKISKQEHAKLYEKEQARQKEILLMDLPDDDE
jgi:hydrogenase maturation factor